MDHNPAWRTYKYAGQKKEKKIADDETVKKLIRALEAVSILYETYFKLIIATGIRRGECCGIKWSDIDYAGRSIHICRNVVKAHRHAWTPSTVSSESGLPFIIFFSLGMTPKQTEKWLNEQAVLFERDCRHTPQPVQQLTLAKYIDL